MMKRLLIYRKGLEESMCTDISLSVLYSVLKKEDPTICANNMDMGGKRLASHVKPLRAYYVID